LSQAAEQRSEFRAAQYVRASTEHQQYSTQNQADKIKEYADHRNMEIVCTYSDDGKSGLSIGGRASLKKLIADVEAGCVDFNVILVYDVSRWGRFQDTDESAYYEYICRRAGIQVAYCAEQFENDGSPNSTIIKSVKRAMAGEYSRELSVKVFAGQCRLIELGLALMGKPGVGKTQFLLKMLTDIRIQSNYQTNFVYFDYKGDVVDNENFLRVAKVQPYRLLQAGQSLPINPFVLPSYDDQNINISAREKAESFASINSKLGVVQKGALTEAIRAGYAKRSGSSTPYPDFQDILEIVTAAYEEDGKKDDSLIEVLRDLSDFDLFWRHGSESLPIEKVSNRTLLIDVHAMPVLKELVAYLVIERLYKEMANMPDSPVIDGNRTIRSILVIDEAHNYLSQKNIFLQRIIREGRSKGVVVFFASQSPNDYQQDFFNFQELLEFAYIFQCEGVSANSVQKILGCSTRTAKDLQTEIARLEPWQVVSRSIDKTEEFVKFEAEAFYKTY